MRRQIMKIQSRAKWIGIALGICAGIACGIAPQLQAQEKTDKPVLAKEETAIFKAITEQIAMYKKRDVEGVMRYYVHRPDLSVFDSEEPEAVLGWDACRKYTEQQIGAVRSIDKLELSKVQVHASGELGFLAAAWTLEATTNEGEKVSQSGRVTEVLQKLDGKWLILHEHNSALPGSAAQAKQ